MSEKLEAAIEQAAEDLRTRTTTTYRVSALPGHKMWNVTFHDFPGLTAMARRVDEIEREAAKALIDYDAVSENVRINYSFNIAVEMAEPYQPIPGTAEAIVVDIDGTLALHNHRGPYDFHKVETDDLCQGVATFVNLMFSRFSEVILLSGRQAEYRPHTERWLDKHHIGYNELHMRPEGDRASDCLVKAKLFDHHVRNRFTVTHVLDDRDRCVYLWRKLGLPCWQVAEGNF